MRYADLPIQWKRIFELEWQSVCEGSKAIAAVILNEKGEIVSEGRNQSVMSLILQPRMQKPRQSEILI